MASLVIHDLDPQVASALERLAARNKLSLEAEARRILTEAAEAALSEQPETLLSYMQRMIPPEVRMEGGIAPPKETSPARAADLF